MCWITCSYLSWTFKYEIKCFFNCLVLSMSIILILFIEPSQTESYEGAETEKDVSIFSISVIDKIFKMNVILPISWKVQLFIEIEVVMLEQFKKPTSQKRPLGLNSYKIGTHFLSPTTISNPSKWNLINVISSDKCAKSLNYRVHWFYFNTKSLIFTQVHF